ncbi:hypothetical protein JJV70_17735 [Streptomyces sp. JJ66]|uniref:hypothetical protein n=1 Tax=Streptomyces sp. JJ66 TaxID=2803843 RepID=UPI001C57DB6D|nr:hypothetical protein [Streptomyces sp. JJ66]MBW1603911.1 hypothetical protein [Streptomyces sp. JJ66]
MDSEVQDLVESGDIIPPQELIDTEAQLDYLTSRRGGRAALDRAGVPRRTARRWQAGARNVSRINREKINQAYWTLRATNWRRSGRTLPPTVRQAIAPQLRQRAHGRRMTIEPVDPRDVARQAQGAQSTASERTVRPSQRSWDRLIDSWATGDETLMEDAWMDFASEIDSPPELYYEVAHIGFTL